MGSLARSPLANRSPPENVMLSLVREIRSGEDRRKTAGREEADSWSKKL